MLARRTSTERTAYAPRPIKRNRRNKSDIAAICDEICTVLAADHPMTVRPCFYALTVRCVIAKTEAEYKGTVIRLLCRLRRAGAVPYSWISDNTRWMRKPASYAGLHDFLQQTARFYRRDLGGASDSYVEFWCEKEALGKSILPTTPIGHTPSDGVHVYFSCIDLEIRNSAGTKGLGLGLDIRGEGGQVVLPSPNSGYWWDPHWNFDTVAPLPAPAWLGHRTRQERRQRPPGERRHFDPHAILAESCRRIRFTQDGEKHDTYRHETFRIARLVRDGFLSERDARHALEPEIMALGKRADGHLERVGKYYDLAFAEGLAAAPRRVRR